MPGILAFRFSVSLNHILSFETMKLQSESVSKKQKKERMKEGRTRGGKEKEEGRDFK